MELFIHSATLEQMISRSMTEPVLIYKHSLTCPISRAAKERMTLGIQASIVPYPAYIVPVQTERALSNEIAASLGVQHESPQLILLSEGKAVYAASHGDIKPSTIPSTDGSQQGIGTHADWPEVPNVCYDIEPEPAS